MFQPTAAAADVPVAADLVRFLCMGLGDRVGVGVRHCDALQPVAMPDNLRISLLLSVIFRPVGRKMTDKRGKVPCCRRQKRPYFSAIVIFCMTSPCRMASTTSRPSITLPNTVCLPFRCG